MMGLIAYAILTQNDATQDGNTKWIEKAERRIKQLVFVWAFGATLGLHAIPFTHAMPGPKSN